MHSNRANRSNMMAYYHQPSTQRCLIYKLKAIGVAEDSRRFTLDLSARTHQRNIDASAMKVAARYEAARVVPAEGRFQTDAGVVWEGFVIDTISELWW